MLKLLTLFLNHLRTKGWGKTQIWMNTLLLFSRYTLTNICMHRKKSSKKVKITPGYIHVVMTHPVVKLAETIS